MREIFWVTHIELLIIYKSICIPFKFASPVLIQADIGNNSSTILNNHAESGQPWLVPEFGGIPLCFSSFNLILTIDLLYTAIIMLRYAHYFPNFSCSFIMKRCWIGSETFSPSDGMKIFFFSFMKYIYWISYIKTFWHAWDKLYLLIRVFGICFWISIVNNLLSIFCANVHKTN